MIKKEINIPVQIGDININSENQSIFYTEDHNLINTFNQVSAKGLVGNVFFIEKKIAVDLINNQFGISKE